MYRGKIDHDVEILKAHRQQSLWAASNIIAAIAGSVGVDRSAKDIFDQLTGERQITEDDDYDDGGSLAQAKAARREQEAKNPRGVASGIEV